MSCPRVGRLHFPPPPLPPRLTPSSSLGTALLQRVNQVQGEADKLKSGNETLQTCKRPRFLLPARQTSTADLRPGPFTADIDNLTRNKCVPSFPLTLRNAEK